MFGRDDGLLHADYELHEMGLGTYLAGWAIAILDARVEAVNRCYTEVVTGQWP